MGITTTQILDLFSKNYTFGSSGIVKTHTHPKTQVHDMFLLNSRGFFLKLISKNHALTMVAWVHLEK